MIKYKFKAGELVEILENEVKAKVGVRSKTKACFSIGGNFYYKLKTGHIVPEESLKSVKGEEKDMFKKKEKEKYNFDKNKKYTIEEIEEIFKKAEEKVLDDLRESLKENIDDSGFIFMTDLQNMLVMSALYSKLFQE